MSIPAKDGSVQIQVNGESREIDLACTIAGLLTQLGLNQQPCAVELNGRIVPRESQASTTLQTGDELEIVTLVGGG